jgi:integrase
LRALRTWTLFRRPAKSELRSERIERTKSLTVDQISDAFNAANHVGKCWIALGICGAFNNSDVANFSPVVYDAATGIIDYRRRKTGKIRRVIPLPPDVMKLLADYVRPEPANPDCEQYFFLTRSGLPYHKTGVGDFKPSDSISRLTARLFRSIKIEGKNFSGLRTSHYNLAPTDRWERERKIVMGRSLGTIDLDSYLEEVGVKELRHYVQFIWNQISTSPADATSPVPAATAHPQTNPDEQSALPDP